MKKKYMIYTLSTIPLAITVSNISDSDAFFRLDSFITKNKTVSDIVEIKDENLLKAINNQLGRGEVLDSVTIADMESLTYLNAQERNISSIEGIEYAVNLRELNLGSNKLVNISSLRSLTQLTKLYIYDNQISDISVLSNLTNLTELYIGYPGKNGNNVGSISSLSNLINLKKLNIEGNKISDISAIRGLTNLIHLNLYNNQVSDISPLSNLTNLNNLHLGYNRIVSVSSLSSLINLTYLHISNNQISDISPLENLANLKELYLSYNQISYVPTLDNLTNLTCLYLNGNQITDISAIENLTALTNLHLSNNQISDISPLSNLTNLSYLQLNNNQISDISILDNLIKLTELHLNNNKISNILSVGNLVNLNKLELYDNYISDISCISNLINLTELSLSTNQISNISSLSNLKKLTYLDLTVNQISDISPLNSLYGLKDLRLGKNQISNISYIKHLKNLDRLSLHNQDLIIEVGDFKSKSDKLDISINNPIVGLNNRNLNISSISNSGVYEDGKLKWDNVSLGNHIKTFNFSENITIGSATATFSGIATLNFNVVDGGAPESDHTSEFDNNDFAIYTTVTAEDLGTGVDCLMHKGVRQSLPYRFKYDILESSNNIVEVYDLAGNKAEYQVKLKDSDIPTIEEGLDALVNKSDSEKEDISYFRKIINDLDESMNKDLLQNRLNDIYPKTLTLDRELATSNMDVYIKSENILQMALDTNSITFEDFSGIEDMVKENAVNISINSSLPYQLNAYLPVEIQNSDKSNTMDKDILNIKENSENIYQTFTNTIDKIILKDNCSAGNDLVHGVDIKLKDGIAHQKDVYKTTIKFEAEQK